MINIFSTKSVNIISLILTIIVFFIISSIFNNFSKANSENSKVDSEKIISQEFSKDIIQEDGKHEEQIKEKEELSWYIEIGSINLKAPIEETTDSEILNKYVGHFEETALKDGNVGLAAHNRGYENNYFENLKNVKKGEEIKYKYYDFEKIYIIDKIEKIKSTNWSYLENTEKNKITLITCVENEPDYRLCVQAIEK